jgi:uncharacterized protein YoxC
VHSTFQNPKPCHVSDIGKTIGDAKETVATLTKEIADLTQGTQGLKNHMNEIAFW